MPAVEHFLVPISRPIDVHALRSLVIWHLPSGALSGGRYLSPATFVQEAQVLSHKSIYQNVSSQGD